MAIIYHITTQTLWDAAQKKKSYTAPSLDTEGFIHCSEARQVAGVLERYYKGQTSLLKLHIQTLILDSPLKYEMAPSINEEFPHIYGPINLNAVVKVERVEGL